MPIPSSRMPGCYRMGVEQRRESLARTWQGQASGLVGKAHAGAQLALALLTLKETP